MAKDNKHSFDLITPADALDYDPLVVSKKVEVNITKNKGRKKPPVDYKPVSKDFIKTDRQIFDVCVPFIMDKYSSGTSILYLMLYRLTYGFRKNVISINDDDLARRTGIPKRTLAKYRDELVECDLISFSRGYKTTRKPKYEIRRPEQSIAFRNILHKTANNLQKDVKSSVGVLIDKVIDKHTTHIETLVRKFYTDIGKTEYHLTRKMLADGIRTIQSLLSEGYKFNDIEGCVKYTIDTKPDVYSISFLNYKIGEYLALQEKENKRKKVAAEEVKKQKIRNHKIALENELQRLFDELPKNEQNTMTFDAEEKAHQYMKDNKITHGETFIIRSYMHELMEEKFSDVVRNW